MGIVTTIAPIALALIMLALGASLTVKDFTRVVQNPKDFFIGLICQLILLPIIAYFLIIILRTPIELALGVMLPALYLTLKFIVWLADKIEKKK